VQTPEGPQPPARFEGGVWEIMGLVSLVREEHERAAVELERSRDAVLRLPDDSPWKRDNLGAARVVIGQAALARGDVALAEAEFAAAREIWGELASPIGIALADMHTAQVEIEGGRHDAAAGLLARALEVLRDVEHAQFSVDGLDAAAAIVLARADPGEALRCLGASTRLRERAGYRAYGWVARVRERVLEDARQALDPNEADAAWEDGRTGSSMEAIDRVLRLLAPPRGRRVSRPRR
jgi:hypothetical protein